MAEALKPYQLGLFGHPVKHSQSPQIHQRFAAQFGIDLTYELIDASPEQLADQFKAWIGRAHGCNITVPHKTRIMPLLDHYTERAHQCQAVNTVFWRDGELWGDNTDGDGLILDLQSKGVELAGKDVLILGAGGAAQGIIPSLLDQRVALIDIKNRNINKAFALASHFERCHANKHMDKDQGSQAYDLIIHATSMGHLGLAPELMKRWFHDHTVVYDLSYGDAAKPLICSAMNHGAAVVYDGLGMLYGQAALAFEIWFGQRPEIKPPLKD